jgi:hypothetical protein
MVLATGESVSRALERMMKASGQGAWAVNRNNNSHGDNSAIRPPVINTFLKTNNSSQTFLFFLLTLQAYQRIKGTKR